MHALPACTGDHSHSEKVVVCTVDELIRLPGEDLLVAAYLDSGLDTTEADFVVA